MNQDIDACDEEKLIRLLANGNEYAFQLLYDRHHHRIYKVAMRYLKSPVTAQEVVQDVFMTLWSKREKINPEMPVEAWLYTVSKNNILNRLKKLSNEWKALSYLKATANTEDDSLQERIKDTDYSNILKNSLRTLSEMQLRVFRMAREENLSYLQIAEHLNISPLTVKTHMSRALSHLRDTVSLNLISILFFSICILK